MESDGTPWRPLVHLLDICKAIAFTLEAPRERVHNQILNVGNLGANYQIREVAAIVGRVFPDCQVTVGSRGGDTRSYRVAFDKINEVLTGFRCDWDAELGARQLLEVFSSIGLTEEDFSLAQLHAPQAARVPPEHAPDRRVIPVGADRHAVGGQVGLMAGAADGEPLVDVGVPTYGEPAYLAETIASVVGQTFTAWQLTISENGPGSDHVRAIVEPFLTDPRVRLVATGHNIGARATRPARLRPAARPTSRSCTTTTAGRRGSSSAASRSSRRTPRAASCSPTATSSTATARCSTASPPSCRRGCSRAPRSSARFTAVTSSASRPCSRGARRTFESERPTTTRCCSTTTTCGCASPPATTSAFSTAAMPATACTPRRRPIANACTWGAPPAAARGRRRLHARRLLASGAAPCTLGRVPAVDARRVHVGRAARGGRAARPRPARVSGGSDRPAYCGARYRLPPARRPPTPGLGVEGLGRGQGAEMVCEADRERDHGQRRVRPADGGKTDPPVT